MYTDKQILDRLSEHLIVNMGSVWTMHRPTWQGVMKRMKKDDTFAEKVRDCEAEAMYLWEKMGIDALRGDNTDFNTGLYKHFTQNKKPFIDHITIELEERISELEQTKTSE